MSAPSANTPAPANKPPSVHWTPFRSTWSRGADGFFGSNSDQEMRRREQEARVQLTMFPPGPEVLGVKHVQRLLCCECDFHRGVWTRSYAPGERCWYCGHGECDLPGACISYMRYGDHALGAEGPVDS